MHAFDHQRAVDLKAVQSRAPNTLFLAGGQGLLPELKHRTCSPPVILDVKALLPRTITVSEDWVKIGAGATHSDIASDPALRTALPALAALAANVGDPSVRHRGTLGGALAQNHPASDWAAAALALSAVLETDLRSVALDDYLAEMTSGSTPSDLILHVIFRRPTHAAYVKMLHPAQRFPIVGSFVSNVHSKHAVALIGLSETGAFRWRAAETALDEVMELPDVTSPERPRADQFASVEYRVHLARTLTLLAVERMKNGVFDKVSIVHGKPM